MKRQTPCSPPQILTFPLLLRCLLLSSLSLSLLPPGATVPLLARRPSATTRTIVGGRYSRIEDSLFQVSLQTAPGGAHFCGGAAIAERWILTAAHCVHGITNPKSIQIRYKTLTYNSGGSLARISRILSHPSFNYETNDNDLALLYTATPLTIAPLSLVRLPNQDETPTANSLLTIYGWGYTSENATRLTSQLQSVTVSVAPTGTCTSIYGNALTENMFCAGEPEGGKDACKGDSGGAAVDEANSQLMGIVSWGYACARAMYPGVYTKVGNYVDWILESGVTLNY